MLWRIVELARDVTRRLSRRKHQKYKPQMKQRSAGGGGGHDVIEGKDWGETITLPIRNFSVSLSSSFPTDIAFIRCRS